MAGSGWSSSAACTRSGIRLAEISGLESTEARPARLGTLQVHGAFHGPRGDLEFDHIAAHRHVRAGPGDARRRVLALTKGSDSGQARRSYSLGFKGSYSVPLPRDALRGRRMMSSAAGRPDWVPLLRTCFDLGVAALPRLAGPERCATAGAVVSGGSARAGAANDVGSALGTAWALEAGAAAARS